MLMTHIVAGYPTMKKCKDLAVLMAESAVDFIEIQIPFSDPVADGPTIMAANQVALDSGVKLADCFNLMRELNDTIDVPLLFMSYFNILHHYGVDRFCKEAAACGCYGLIVPDMPLDEEPNEGYLAACKKYGLNAIQVVSPLTKDERLKKIANVASGFVYCVSRFGTTGGNTKLNDDLAKYLSRVKNYINLPLAVGFGISSKKDVEMVHKNAEIAVIGSKVISLINDSKNYERDVKDFLEFCAGGEGGIRTLAGTYVPLQV